MEVHQLIQALEAFPKHATVCVHVEYGKFRYPVAKFDHITKEDTRSGYDHKCVGGDFPYGIVILDANY